MIGIKTELNYNMETKKYIQKNVPGEFLIDGIYFKSSEDIMSEYFITIDIIELKSSAIIKIYNMDIPSNLFDAEGLVNGSEIKIYEPSYCICEIDLFEKYYFPNLRLQQLYYDDKKYYGQKHKSNEITSLMECINFAVDYGLNKAEIKPC